MTSLTIQSWLSLTVLFQLLVVAKINITYPTEDTIYPQGGPYPVQWVWSSDDPSNITIYLETFDGDKLANNLRGITWPTSDGSVTITMSEQPPRGNTWKWAIYDTSEPIQLGSNHIAESPRFLIRGSTLPSSSASSTPSTTTTPSSSQSAHARKKLSADAAAAIGVVVTLVIVVSLLAGFYFFRRSRRALNCATYDSAPGGHSPDTHPPNFQKPELDSKDSANDYSSSTGNGQYQPTRVPYTAELTSDSRHEMPGDLQLGGQSMPHVVPRKQLASTISRGV